MASDGVVNALLALAAGDRGEAARLVGEAAAGPDPGLVAPALARHLAAGDGDVYTDGSAFERFVDGGGNVGLYRAAHAALAEAHRRAAPRTVVDLGCGDGRLSASAVRPGVERVDLVEPSADLLGDAVARLTGGPGTGPAGGTGTGPEIVAHPATAQAFLGSTDARWDAAQSTFALHALGPADRSGVLRTLASRARRLLVVEFDVPAFADRSAEHARYAAGRYEAGVAEYRDDEAVVAGFLMPVLAGQFDPAEPRHTWEQPIAAWVADLEAAGFPDVRHRPVAGYWWAPAELIEAVP